MPFDGSHYSCLKSFRCRVSTFTAIPARKFSDHQSLPSHSAEVLRIWDFLFSDQSRFDFLINICCAMLMLLKRDLMEGDFANNMKLLQNFPDRIDVCSVTRKAKSLSNAFITKG